MDIKELEQRITDLERRFFPIEKVLYEKYRSEIETKKDEDIQRDGTTYKVSALIETDLGRKAIQFEVKAWSEKQALYYANEKIIYPNLTKKKEEGLIKWFKTISKQIVK